MSFELDLTQIVIAIIGLVFTGVLIPLSKAGFEWLKNKTQNEAIKAALNEAEIIAENVVMSLQQTVVDGLKEKSADGKLTTEEIRDVAEIAFDMFISDISSKSLEVIENNADDISTYIANLIESRLFQIKK